MVYDKYGRQIEVDDEVIVRCRVDQISASQVRLRTVGAWPIDLPWMCSERVEKVASDPGPFLTNDMPVKAEAK